MEEEEEWSGKRRCRSWWKIFCWHTVMVLCPVLKSNCVQVLWAIIGRECVPCRPDNNHPFFTRSCGGATTKELSTMGNINSLLQKYQRFLGKLSSFPFFFVSTSLEKLIVFPPPICKKLPIYPYLRRRGLVHEFFRNFSSKEGDEESRKNGGTTHFRPFLGREKY